MFKNTCLIIGDRNITPIVPKYDNCKLTLYIENGLFTIVINKAIISVFMVSAFLYKSLDKIKIIAIIHARITDTEKFVKNKKNIKSKIINIYPLLLEILT